MPVRTIDIVPLGPVAGAEVKGVDLRQPVPTEVAGGDLRSVVSV